MDVESSATLGQSSSAMHDDKEGVISSHTVRQKAGGPSEGAVHQLIVKHYFQDPGPVVNSVVNILL